MLSNYEIRKRARENLGGDIFKAQWLYPVLVLFIISAISAAVGFTWVGPIVLAGVLGLASAGYFLGRARGKVDHKNIEVTIDCVRNDLTGSMITGILANLIIALGSILFVVPGIILSYAYSMIYFVRLDNPTLGAWEAIKESERLMKGHKMQYFQLQVSFIGWMIVGACCLGLGSLWVSAYMNTANAIFYDEILAQDGGYHNEYSQDI